MTLTGYPAEDLVLRESFARASEHALVDLAADAGRAGARATSPSSSGTSRTPRAPARRRSTAPPTDDDRPGDANPRRGAPRNAAALLYGGEVVVRYYKRHLPNYGVFDEARYFVPGHRAAGRPAARDRRRADHLRGPLGRGRPVRGGRPGRASTSSSPPTPRRTSGPRTTCGCRWSAAARPRRGAHDRLLQPGRRAGRARLRRRLARRLRRTASCWPARRSSSSTC